jgi:hypothetical protein
MRNAIAVPPAGSAGRRRHAQLNAAHDGTQSTSTGRPDALFRVDSPQTLFHRTFNPNGHRFFGAQGAAKVVHDSSRVLDEEARACGRGNRTGGVTGNIEFLPIEKSNRSQALGGLLVKSKKKPNGIRLTVGAGKG